MVVRSRLALILRAAISRQTTRYAPLFIRIYTRTFVGHRHNYEQCFGRLVKEQIVLPTPIAFRYIFFILMYRVQLQKRT